VDPEKNIIIIKKKKASAHAGHHGGAWKVAYADFVTAMMAFFMVMWLMGTDAETAKAIEAYFQTGMISRDGLNKTGAFNGGDASRTEGGAHGRFEEKEVFEPHFSPPVYVEEYAILRDLSDYYDGSAFTKDLEGDWVKYTITPRLKFAVGENSVYLNNENRKFILKMIEVFKQHDGIIIVEGYPDKDKEWNLAYGRAASVVNLLGANGVNKSRLIPVIGAAVREDGDGMAELSALDAGTVRFILKRKRHSP
jgi:chemotaxis protein MotB